MAISNYGVVLKRSGSAIAEVVSLDPPEILHETIESTNHGSGGWKERVPSKVKEISEFTAKINWTTSASLLSADLVAGTLSAYSLDFPTTPATSWTFSSYITAYKMEEIDAQSPETLMASVTFSPSGSAVLA